MSRLSNLRVVDPVLTQLARGYNPVGLVAEALFPFVPMEKEAGKVPAFGKEAFKIYSTERAIRASSNRINPEARTTVDVALTEHDLEYPVDYREEQEDLFPLEQYAMSVVVKAIQTRREKIAADLAQATSTYASSNRVTLSGNDLWTAKTTSHPIDQIETAKEAIRASIGQYPNVMVMGAIAFADAKVHPDFLDRIKYTQKAVLSEDLIGSLVNIPKVVVGKAVYSTDAGAFTDLWADNVILAYIPEADAGGRSMFAPSFAYTFRKTGQPVVDKYDEKAKLRIVRNTDIFQCKVVGAEAGYLINNTR